MIDFGDYDVFETPQAYPIILTGDRINKENPSRSLDEFQPDDYVFTFAEATDALPTISQTAVRAESNGEGEAGKNSEESPLAEPEREIGQDPPESRIADIVSACLPATSDENPPEWSEIKEKLAEIIPDNRFEDIPIRAFSVPSSMIATEDWRFVPAEEETVLRKIESGGTALQEYTDSKKLAKNGVQTGRNSVFLVDNSTISDYNIEDEIVKPLVTGENVMRWHSEVPESPKLLYTTPQTDLDDYPNAKEYLTTEREDLASRYCVTDGIREWYELAEYRPDTFGQELIFTPDVSYYSNFWYEPTGEVYGLNTVYVLYIIDEFDPYYQLGIFNSNVAQFFIRRVASSYGSDYLRYQWDYMKKVPLPDPQNAPDEQIETVRDIAEELSQLREEYIEAKHTESNPQHLLDEFETESLSYAGYIDRLGYHELEGDLSPRLNGDTIEFGVTGASIDFSDEHAAKAVFNLLGTFKISDANDLSGLKLPPLKEDLLKLVGRYEDALDQLESAPDRARELEESYNQVVYELYNLDERAKSLIQERVVRPDNPLEPREMD